MTDTEASRIVREWVEACAEAEAAQRALYVANERFHNAGARAQAATKALHLHAEQQARAILNQEEASS